MFTIRNKILPRNVLKYSSYCNKFSTNANKPLILGIETSCDDTGCAVIDGDGNILGESLHSQLSVHLKHGGVIPPLAQDLHRMHIEPTMSETLKNANISLDAIDAIAVTVKPGLPLSLSIGFKYAKYLAKQHSKPLIPIHHMEAHALTVRANHKVAFPFLCLLISGGHCLLTLVNDVNEFKLLGESIDNSPGELFDKTTRRLKLHNIVEFSKMSGGRALETAAKRCKNIESYIFSPTLVQTKDCNFSFGGFKSAMYKKIEEKEKELGLKGDNIIPDAFDLCASLQLHVTRHICHRTQRAMDYVMEKNLIPDENKTLVVSGGVACNNFIFNSLKIACDDVGFNLIRPSPKLCTDNGVMIAWNGVEKFKRNIEIYKEFDSLKIQSKCPLGINIADDVVRSNITCKMLPLKVLYDLQTKSQLEC